MKNIIKLIEEATFYTKSKSKICFNLIILIKVANLLGLEYILNKFNGYNELMIDLQIYELLKYLVQVIITCV